jgi:DNA-binding LytR/AlgR family response regulator
MKVNIISENIDDALNNLLKITPDIIFINIDNEYEKLVSFLFEMDQYSFKKSVFIAISATKDKAYEAIKYDFFDYLLLPITELSLRKCIIKYQKKHLAKINKTICIKSYKDYNYIDTDEILFLKADNNTTDFHMSDSSIISAFKTLKKFENVMPKNFLRIHKSYIINSNFISRIHYGKALCIIKNHSFQIPFTKTFLCNIDTINSVLSNNSISILN